MAERIDYAKVAERVNYPALEKKLEELSHEKPPPRRKHAADVLAPVTGKLRELHAQGWSYQQLVEELKRNGLTITLTALREHMAKPAKKRKPHGKRAGKSAGTVSA